jgi:hypothetical protein
VSKSCPTVQKPARYRVTRKAELTGIIPAGVLHGLVLAGGKAFVFCPSGGLDADRKLRWSPSPGDTLMAHSGLAGAQGAIPATRLCRGVCLCTAPRTHRPWGRTCSGEFLTDSSVSAHLWRGRRSLCPVGRADGSLPVVGSPEPRVFRSLRDRRNPGA